VKVYEGGVGPLAPDIIREVQASNGFVLELGIHTGEGSTQMIQDALADHPNPLHISVDWQDVIAPEHRPKTPWWHLVLGDTREDSTFFKVLHIASPRRPGVIFIDTDHNYKQMQTELALWSAIANDKTVYLMHDTWMYGPENVEMNQAIKEYASAFGMQYADLRTDSHGLGKMWKP
jgi:hypothetical protein